MAKGFKFTLVANTLTAGGITYHKPFSVTLLDSAENQNKIRFYRSLPGFDAGVPVHVDDAPPVSPSSPAEEPTTSVDPTQAPEITSVDIRDIGGLKKEVLQALYDAGYTTPEKILSDDVEFADLLEIPGVGEATANRLIDLCEKAVGEAEEDEE